MPGALRMVPYLAVNYINFNFRRHPFNDIRVREAINLAYDRETMTQKVIGLGEPANISVAALDQQAPERRRVVGSAREAAADADDRDGNRGRLGHAIARCAGAPRVAASARFLALTMPEPTDMEHILAHCAE